MADATQDAAAPPRRGLRPLVLGGCLALAAGAGGFAAVQAGLADGLLAGLAEGRIASVDTAFIELPPMHVSLGSVADGRMLRFAAALEVSPAHRTEVERLTPRLLDLLNSYLRAVDPQDFGAPGALIRLRAQMLRRIQVVTGEGRVLDLLVTEFVVN